jgi:uncharacterized membrane protein
MSEENKLSTEVEILAETIEARTNEFNSTFEKIKKELEAELDNLKKYNVMLQSVPAKIAKQIEDTVPSIALELDSINDKKMDELKKQSAKIEQEHHNSLMAAEQKIHQLTENIKKIDRRRILNFFLGVIISSGIAVGGATYAASYMMQTFPTRVVIDKPENIILYDSDVGLWGTDNVKVLKGLRKNDRKNSGKY